MSYGYSLELGRVLDAGGIKPLAGSAQRLFPGILRGNRRRSRASVLECGSPLFPLPTSFRAAYSSGTGCAVATGWKQKICVHLRNLRTLPFPILWGSISSGQLRPSISPPRTARLRVILSRINPRRGRREVRRFRRFTQIFSDRYTRITAKFPFHRLRIRQLHSVPSPVANFVGNGKSPLPLSHTGRTIERCCRRANKWPEGVEQMASQER